MEFFHDAIPYLVGEVIIIGKGVSCSSLEWRTGVNASRIGENYGTRFRGETAGRYRPGRNQMVHPFARNTALRRNRKSSQSAVEPDAPRLLASDNILEWTVFICNIAEINYRLELITERIAVPAIA